jgi:hypothetical protein
LAAGKVAKRAGPGNGIKREIVGCIIYSPTLQFPITSATFVIPQFLIPKPAFEIIPDSIFCISVNEAIHLDMTIMCLVKVLFELFP